MVTQAIETGARPSNSRNNTFFNKLAYVVGLGCCMSERHVKPVTTQHTPTPLEEIKAADMNWSTSTLGIETDLNLRPEAIHSDSNMPDTRDFPLSSFEFYPPPPTSPPRAARPQSRPRREPRRGTESPVITITDHDIATGTTPSTGECQREREERKLKKDKKNRDRKNTSTSKVQAWSQIDPMYGMYQQERERRSERQNQSQSQSQTPYSNIRAFDFMSYGGWIVI
ncbi:hypothetical protein H2200_007410 [Cladophialophora chaetospira]|uniref:Uncharacterized protein n=1 Tax=Cladophialophora chaetospira TaxID=386627 RepID=A0AA38X7R3_9EURO|nr:hypothetical protein H2200_007410 [Cladophialophora chaetospira]